LADDEAAHPLLPQYLKKAVLTSGADGEGGAEGDYRHGHVVAASWCGLAIETIRSIDMYLLLPRRQWGE